MKTPPRKIPSPHATQHRRVLPWIGALVFLLLVLLVAVPGAAHAATANCTTTSAGTLNMGSVTVEPDMPVGTLLGTPTSITMRFTCTNIPGVSDGGNSLFIQAGGLAPRDAMDTGANGIIFATSIDGIGLKLTSTDDMPKAEVCLQCGPFSTAGFEIGPVSRTQRYVNQNFTAQFIKTKAEVSPGTVQGVRLMQFWWYEYGFTASSGPMSTGLTLNGGATVAVTGCKVNTDSQNMTVTLPRIGTAALPAVNSTAGRTRFNINLNCQAGTTARITFATTSAYSSANGVINPTTGTGMASNVGIQLLNAAASAPVPFNVAQSMGATPNGAWTLPFHVQYYRTGAITAGNVRGTLTFTMTYQ
ncbi:fimbrial protein [Lysobacter auxotrophicus]|uniref:Type 1 fimbrial protein n=1 Tax=Lysobacter auxotrophicus TaxID=2992573 RepID=A0ABN6UF55_9GAMM|nr:fimbrial protein [Lysobacter auxotrophicus]BDU14962.1 type 1 fimbrial protein [Lysobacter auxotrophicus]